MGIIRENRDELSRLYEQLVNQVVKELPLEWTNCCIGFFVDARQRESLQVYLSCNEGKIWHDFMEDVFSAEDIMEGIFDCKETCRELYTLCSKAGDKWTGFTLIVDKMGGFSAEFDYTELDEFNSFRKKMWIGKYLD